ncbi:unnamed protein product [Periconia digitata]|uniref:Cytochrome P450 n=1 Tax=Periconia digitata TaxID=1303443 RepID=A0A9W4XM86_9PLEO|nr:unnamed protein product [Periconia digitata]
MEEFSDLPSRDVFGGTSQWISGTFHHFNTYLYLYTALAGISAHLLLFKYGEWHMQAPVLFRLYVIATLSTTILAIVVHGYETGTWRSLSLNITFMFSLFSSIGIYRVFFHRLKNFPGPIMARTTKLWHVWKCITARSRNHHVLDNIHKQYGDFVRTGPSEITIFHPEVFTAIDGPRTKCTKADWYDILLPELAINTTRDKVEHDHRRKIWNTAFTSSDLVEYQHGVVAKLAGDLERIVERAARDGEVVRFSECLNWFSFDVMGEFAFAQSFHMLQNQQWHHAVTLIREASKMLGIFNPAPWLTQIGFHIGGNWLHGVRDWNEGLGWCRIRMAERIETQDVMKKTDISSHLIEASRNAGMITKQDRMWLNGDSITLVVAGSDTVSSTLTFLFHTLALHPHHQTTLFHELSNLHDCTNQSALAKLPHLNGVINEILRLHPAVPTGGNRLTPAEGITVAGTYIPGNTNIVAPRYTIARLESCFENAGEFMPERWYEIGGGGRTKGFAPFGMGRYACVGKQLALAELRLVTALLVSKYEFRIVDGKGGDDDGADIVEGMRDQFTAQPGGELKLRFWLRGAEGE